MAGKLIYFIGIESKCGTTMISRSMGQFLAFTAKEKTLWMAQNGKGSVFSPEDLAGLYLREAGVEYLSNDRWKGSMEDALERFSWVCVDGGTLPYGPETVSVVNRAWKVIWVAEQGFRCINRAEEQLQKWTGPAKADAALERTPDCLVLNRFRENDPFTAAYCRQRFDRWPALQIVPVGESPRGREAEWEEMTLYELRDRGFRRDLAAVSRGIGYDL